MKIIQVINAMIANSEKIANVIKNDKEYFFLYNTKHKWSIKENFGDYVLFFYPTTNYTIDELANITAWDNFNDLVTYKSDEIKTREAIESFSELYQIVSEKLYGLDDIFDEIISNF